MVAVLVSFACGSSGALGPSSVVAVDVKGPGRVLSIPPGIDCPRVCTATFPAGATVPFAADPADDGAFREWSGDCTGTTGCHVPMSGRVAVVAWFDVR